MVESDPEHLILRTIALAIIRIAMHYDGLAAEMYLIDHMSERPPDEWRARFWFPQLAATAEGVRWPASLFEEFAKILKARFWLEVRSGYLPIGHGEMMPIDQLRAARQHIVEIVAPHSWVVASAKASN